MCGGTAAPQWRRNGRELRPCIALLNPAWGRFGGPKDLSSAIRTYPALLISSKAEKDAQNAHPEGHRLRRFYPATRDEVVSGLFETLALERGTEPAQGAWSLDIDGFALHPSNIQEIDRLLARQDRLEQARVKDPFGHVYRPARHRKHRYLPAAAGSILYIETPARGPLRSVPHPLS